MNYKYKKFSLIELLVVMVITSILLAIVIPTFVKVTKGVNVEMGARQLGAQLKAVREYAITNRKYVGLIMCDDNLPVGYRHKAYRPCEVNSSYAFQDWISGERWEFMPDGARINSVSSGVSVTGVTDDTIGLGSTDFSTTIVFFPTGKASVNAAGSNVQIGEGVDADTTSSPNTVNITVAGYTGRVSYDG